MALVEPRLLESLQSQHQHHHQPRDMLDNKLCELDQAMQDILNQKEVPQEEKLKLYNHILQKYLLYNKKVEPFKVEWTEKENTPTSAQTPHTPNTAQEHALEGIEAEIMESTPKNLKRKASLLMRRLKQDDNIGWNTKGELMYKGEVVSHTHIQDLVQDVLRKRKNHIPRGWQTFAKALKESNIPQDLIGNQDRWDWMNQTESPRTRAERRLENLAATSSALEIYEPKLKSRPSKQLRWTPYK